MLNTIFSKGSIPVLEQMLYFTEERAKVISNNIANADTPGFVPKDLPVDSFKSALLQAVSEAQKREVPTVLFEGVDGARPKPKGGLNIDYAPREPWAYMKHDRNAFSIEQEISEMNKNTSMHYTVASILAQQLSIIREAISEKING